jgi:hypothetical protein
MTQLYLIALFSNIPDVCLSLEGKTNLHNDTLEQQAQLFQTLQLHIPVELSHFLLRCNPLIGLFPSSRLVLLLTRMLIPAIIQARDKNFASDKRFKMIVASQSGA